MGETDVGPVDVSGENNFPAALDACTHDAATFKGQGTTWHRAASVEDALRLLGNDDDNVRLVGSNTSVGIYKSQPERVLVAVSHLPELSAVSSSDAGVSFGSMCTLTALQYELQKQLKSQVCRSPSKVQGAGAGAGEDAGEGEGEGEVEGVGEGAG
jgi:hypothetical protein